jgi:hypothetical protein
MFSSNHEITRIESTNEERQRLVQQQHTDSMHFISDLRRRTNRMAATEPACYTLINASHDLEPLSEMQLREDLEKGNDKVCGRWLLDHHILRFSCFLRVSSFVFR